jgi:carboxymethylenebutenolidase
MNQQSTDNPRRQSSWITAMAVAVLAAFERALGLFAPRPDTIRTFTADEQETGIDVRVDCFFPSNHAGGSGRSPAVIMLHGVEGSVFLRHRHYRDARKIARGGYAVFFVHYFDPLPYNHLFYAKPWLEVDTEKVDEHIYGKNKGDRRVWIDTAKEAVRWTARQPEVDPDRMALLAYSLGGMIALSTADECMNRNDLPDLRCVVLNWSARFEDATLTDKMPPVQFLHGEEDRTIPVARARQTAAELEAMGVPAQVISYPGKKHVLGGKTADDSRTHASRFFDRNL